MDGMGRITTKWEDSIAFINVMGREMIGRSLLPNLPNFWDFVLIALAFALDVYWGMLNEFCYVAGYVCLCECCECAYCIALS